MAAKSEHHCCFYNPRQHADLLYKMLVAIVTAHASHREMSGLGKPVETCMLSH